MKSFWLLYDYHNLLAHKYHFTSFRHTGAVTVFLSREMKDATDLATKFWCSLSASHRLALIFFV